MCDFSKHNLQPGGSSPEHTGLGVHPPQPSPRVSSRQHHPACVHFGLVRTFHCALGPRVLSCSPDLGAPATRTPGLWPSAPCGPCRSGPRSARGGSTPWPALSASAPLASDVCPGRPCHGLSASRHPYRPASSGDTDHPQSPRPRGPGLLTSRINPGLPAPACHAVDVPPVSWPCSPLLPCPGPSEVPAAAPELIEASVGPTWSVGLCALATTFSPRLTRV